MARNVRLLAFLWLVVACHTVVQAAGRAESTTTAAPSTTGASSTTAATTTAAPSTTGASSTTAATTTTAPTTTGASSTTAATTTTAPTTTGASSTTAATTTAAPTTTGASSTTAATTTAAPTTTGASSTTGPATTPPATEEPPAPPPGLCSKNPCGQGSTCQDRADVSFVCLCLPGANYNYDTKSCENAKVFPGQLTVNKIEFVEDLKDNKSPKFKEEAKKITDTLTEVYNDTTGYANSTVLEFLPDETTSKVWTRSGGVIASIEIIFAANTAITTDKVKMTMNKVVACETCVLAGGSFKNKNLCDTKPCDSTANCTSTDGSFNCICKENYIKTNFSDRICIACPSGQKLKNVFECEDCPFGYSGFNCNESWQLALVIVGSVLGALLLVTLILLPVVALKAPKKKSKKNKNTDSGDYDSSAPVKAPLVSSNSSFGNSQAPAVNGSAFGNAAVPRIPRATPTSGWDSRTNLEMTQSNSRQTPTPVGRNPQYDDHISMNPYQSRQSSLYSQGQPQNNLYGQNRAQSNPYAQSQGHTNPYYVHDDGRRY